MYYYYRFPIQEWTEQTVPLMQQATEDVPAVYTVQQ